MLGADNTVTSKENYNAKMSKGVKYPHKKQIVCREDKMKGRTHFLKMSYFVLPLPAFHTLMVPRPGESDLMTLEGNK